MPGCKIEAMSALHHEACIHMTKSMCGPWSPSEPAEHLNLLGMLPGSLLMQPAAVQGTALEAS